MDSRLLSKSVPRLHSLQYFANGIHSTGRKSDLQNNNQPVVVDHFQLLRIRVEVVPDFEATRRIGDVEEEMNKRVKYGEGFDSRGR